MQRSQQACGEKGTNVNYFMKGNSRNRRREVFADDPLIAPGALLPCLPEIPEDFDIIRSFFEKTGVNGT